ncbi:MAG: hypothetical protein ACW99U_18110 [Candidatus Thorarchaeota archaeon]
MVSDSEAKILFREGSELRVLRGEITGEDDIFVNLQRQNGMYRISKVAIVKISLPNLENP